MAAIGNTQRSPELNSPSDRNIHYLDEWVDDHKKVAEDSQLFLDVSPELSGDHTRVEAVHIDPSALKPVDNVS